MDNYNHLTDPLRNKRITASMVGAILGNSPWMTRDDAMRSLVRDALGAEREFEGNIATEYGNNNEAGSIMEFQMETGLTVTPAKFQTRDDWAGASPDGWVSDGGGLECKCPYGLRKGGEFKSLEDQPQYYDQVQFSIWVTEKPHWWFSQWKPDDTWNTKWLPDIDWQNQNLPILRQFHAEFLDTIADPELAAEHLAPKRVTIDTPEAAKMIREYDELSEQIELATERKKDLLKDIAALGKGKNALVAGRKVTKLEKVGAISYAKAVKALLPKADLEPWRGKPSSFWKVT